MFKTRHDIYQIMEIRNIVDTVEGWLTKKEGELLYNLAKNCTGRGVIVEIGSLLGKSTICLGIGSKKGKNVRIYAIDPHTLGTLKGFQNNVENAKVEDVITPLVETSKKAAKAFNKPVELIFIDGIHKYNFVRLDFELWFPKLLNGGIMVFHDTIKWAGPRKVVKELVWNSNFFRNVRFQDSIVFGEKVKQNSVKDRLVNRFFFFLWNNYGIVNKLLPEPLKKIGKKIIS